MRGILSAGALAFLFAFFGTPAAIRVLVKRGYGQFIRDDGPTTHHTKRGTPTMGGIVIIGAVEANQQFDCINGVQMFFGKTLAELNTAIEESIA